MSKRVNMIGEKDRLQDIRKTDCHSVPEGYFKHLEERLVCIPASQTNANKPGITAYVALAGTIAAVAIGGFAILKATADNTSRDEDYMYEQLLYADAIPQTYSLYGAYGQTAASSEISLEEYFNYIND